MTKFPLCGLEPTLRKVQKDFGILTSFDFTTYQPQNIFQLVSYLETYGHLIVNQKPENRDFETQKGICLTQNPNRWFYSSRGLLYNGLNLHPQSYDVKLFFSFQKSITPKGKIIFPSKIDKKRQYEEAAAYFKK
ncbi:MAG: hypothetical protein ACOCXG_01180 [Nanoarchaeota archaeon]